jgi:hypothetical protein
VRKVRKVFTARSVACHLVRIVCRSTVNRFFRVVAQRCVKPRKLKVSGFPSPRACRFGSAHHDAVALRLPRSPSLDPKVEDIVQVDVGQQRTDAAALHGADLTHGVLPVLQHARSQPFLDEPYDAPVCHAVLDEPNQPSVVQRIEEATDIGIQHPVHLLRVDATRERIQRVLRAATRPESVREAEEVRFVDGVQHLDDGALDNLVFQRGNAERPLPPVRLPDVRPTHRPRPVRASLQSAGQILEVRLQPLPVRRPCFSSDAGRSSRFSAR